MAENQQVQQLVPVWVRPIPKELEPGKLYINAEGNYLKHLCPCGCGGEIGIGLHPDGWKMQFDGVYVTIRPSVGCGFLECKSHYLITENAVEWCEPLVPTTVEQRDFPARLL